MSGKQEANKNKNRKKQPKMQKNRQSTQGLNGESPREFRNNQPQMQNFTIQSRSISQRDTNQRKPPSQMLGIIPEENSSYKMTFTGADSSNISYYDKSGGSESSYHTPVLMSYNRGQMMSSGSYSYFNTGNTSHQNLPFSLNSYGGTAGALNFYKRLDQQSDEEILHFTKKLFSFFALQKIFMGLFITITYNNVPFTRYIGRNFFLFAIAAFTFMIVLLMVHVALDFLRKPPQSWICYVLFTLSECWVVAFLLAETDGSTVFLFAVTLDSQVLAVSLFLNQPIITWLRGSICLIIMTIFMFFLSILTLNYTDIVTILVCLVGGLLFGFFLLNKSFTILKRKYSHQLTIQDYIIGSLTIYVDFGFVLLIMLFIMLAMIKSFAS